MSDFGVFVLVVVIFLAALWLVWRDDGN